MEKSGHFSSDSRASRLKVDPEGLSPRTSRSLRLRAEKGLRQRSPAFELPNSGRKLLLCEKCLLQPQGSGGVNWGQSRVSRVTAAFPPCCRQVLSCRPGVYPVTDISRLRRCNLQDRLTVAEFGGTSPSPHTAAGPRAALRSLSCPVHSRRPSPLASASTSLGGLLGRRTRPLSPSSPSPGCLVLLRPLWLESPFYCYCQARKH